MLDVSIRRPSSMAAVAAGAALVLALSVAPWALLPAATAANAAPAGTVDWSTYGFDSQRSGYNPDETTIGVGNAASLHVKWSANLGAVMIAQPVEATGVLVNGSSKDIVYV